MTVCHLSNGCFIIFILGDVNVGGIVAGVIVALLAVGLLLFGLWYANKKGFLPSKFGVCKRAREGIRTRTFSNIYPNRSDLFVFFHCLYRSN